MSDVDELTYVSMPDIDKLSTFSQDYIIVLQGSVTLVQPEHDEGGSRDEDGAEGWGRVRADANDACLEAWPEGVMWFLGEGDEADRDEWVKTIEEPDFL